MNEDTTPCPFCRKTANTTQDGQHHNVVCYANCACRGYAADRRVEQMYLSTERYRGSREQISALLAERHILGRTRPFLHFDRGSMFTIHGYSSLHVDDFLQDWPQTVPDKIDRSFVCLVKSFGEDKVGVFQSLGDADICDKIVFAMNPDAALYIRDAMREYGWLRQPEAYHQNHKVTPKGWAKFDELTRTKASQSNPAFVAMWFGGKERFGEMTSLYEGAIKPAVEAAGYRVKRADTDEHNEPVMDRVVDDIRRAPFVVAELTNGNQGVYYEAGLARGRGIEVIYCVPETDDPEDKPHFDVTGINQVRWKEPDELRQKLEARILGAIERGPHKFESAKQREAVGGER